MNINVGEPRCLVQQVSVESPDRYDARDAFGPGHPEDVSKGGMHHKNREDRPQETLRRRKENVLLLQTVTSVPGRTPTLNK